MKCHYDDKCEVNIENRHICSSCRLKKCFLVGMQTERFRYPRIENSSTNRKRKSDSIISKDQCHSKQDYNNI